MLLCHLSEAVAAPLSLPRRSEAKAGRGVIVGNGDPAAAGPWLQRDPVFQQSLLASRLQIPLRDGSAWIVIPSRADGEGPPNSSEITQSKSGDIRANISVEREAILAWVSLRA